MENHSVKVPTLPDRASPRFDPSEITVVFLLGGPGSGKGTQSELIVRDYGFKHLSAGDLLREERLRQGSPYGELIEDFIREGVIIPMEITITLLENAMVKAIEDEKTKMFLIDGFPREIGQGRAFERVVCPCRCLISLVAGEQVLEARLLNRGKTSGRSDDNIESIRKRFKTFQVTTRPVLEAYEAEGKSVTVEADLTPEQVYENIQDVFASYGFTKVDRSTA